MSGLVDHAHAELTRTGWLDAEDSGQSGQALLDAVEAFSRGGWSGGSAPVAIHILSDLLTFKALSPLTSDPDEWMEIAEGLRGTEEPLWQSRRQSSCFSHDGGKTYYDLSEQPVHYDRWPWLLWKLRLRTSEPVGFTSSRDIAKLPRHESERHA